jgi:hypothetical protein
MHPPVNRKVRLFSGQRKRNNAIRTISCHSTGRGAYNLSRHKVVQSEVIMCNKISHKILTIVLLAVLACVVLIPARVSALGLGISPSKLTVTARPGGIVEDTLYVMNNTDEESQFRVYTDEKYQDWLSIEPEQFTLSPDEARNVEIVITPPHMASGIHDLTIYVVSLSNSSDFQLGAGIRVPTRLYIRGFSISIILLIIEIALIILLSLILVFRRMRSLRSGVQER